MKPLAKSALRVTIGVLIGVLVGVGGYAIFLYALRDAMVGSMHREMADAVRIATQPK